MKNKYVKIVILSTLAEPKTLVDISVDWFQNKGRLYQPIIMKEIKKAVKEGIITQEGKFYRVNFSKLLSDLSIHLGEDDKLWRKYNEELKNFYLKLGDYTQKVYLNYEIIKVLTKKDQNKAEELDISLLIQLPFLLRYMENKDKDLANILIQVMNLEEYVKKVEDFEMQHIGILKEKKMMDSWVESFDKLTSLLPKMQKKGLTIFGKNIKAMKAFTG